MLGDFNTTSWTVILAAKETEATRSRVALNELCSTYWPPVYAYLRQRRLSVEEAQDLTQEFFAHLLEGNFLRNVEPERGRFRSFLLASLRNFLTNAWNKNRAQKRGGSLSPPLPLDFALEEQRYDSSLEEGVDPGTLYDRRWARTLLDNVLGRLRAEASARGKSDVFESLKGYLLSGEEDVSYRETGERVGMSEGAIKMAVHRLRQRYAELLREEVAKTVEKPEDAEQELKYLIEVAGP